MQGDMLRAKEKILRISSVDDFGVSISSLG